MVQKIVVIGGGTGSYTVLRGLKYGDHEVTAIVSMMDSGGSTGILHDEYGVLPPGDVRRCMVALSASPLLVRKAFQYRFTKIDGLKGHTLGNLIITAFKELLGDDLQAIDATCQLLNIKGTVLPVTAEQTNLCAELEDGQVIRGEKNIDMPKHDPMLRIQRVFLQPSVRAYAKALAAIRAADKIVIGPGDLYTSIIPNLLVDGIADAIRDAPAKKVYICNLTTKYGETNSFRAADFVREITKYLGGSGLDVVIVNKQALPREWAEKYRAENAEQVAYTHEELAAFGAHVIEADLLDIQAIVRHNSFKLYELITRL